MRFTMVIMLALLAVAPASAQNPYDLDPYRPSDAVWLRNYGTVLVAQTTLLELRKLDPYVPSQAALIRQLGGGVPNPVSGMYQPFPLTPTPPTLTPFARTQAVIPTAPSVVLIIVSPNSRVSPPPPMQDRQREPDQLHRPELHAAPPRNPGLRVAQRTDRAGRTLFFIQQLGAEDLDGSADSVRDPVED
jgi:hypothetical protein